MIDRRHDAQDRRSILATVILASALLAWPCGELLGNELQRRYCAAGLGFGQAEARTYLFGRAFQGAIPADQRVDIATNLSNASAEIDAADALGTAPFATEPLRQRTVARLIADIEGFAAASAGESYLHQASRIQNLAGRYRALLHTTFMSARGDAFQDNVTCDSAIFNACYFFGKATIASAFSDNRSESFELSALGTFWANIQTGLPVAMDADTIAPDGTLWRRLPYDGHHRKICCTMGTPGAWEALHSLVGTTNPLEVYAAKEGEMLALIADADELDPVCASDDVIVEGPPGPPHSRRDGGGAGSGVIGEWSCTGFSLPGTGVIVERDGRSGVTVTMKHTLVAIHAGDQTEFVSPPYPGSLEGGNVRWEFAHSSGSSSTNFKLSLSLADDGRRLAGTMATTTTSPSGGTSSGSYPISCHRLVPPLTSSRTESVSDTDAIADFIDAASDAGSTTTTRTAQPRWVLAQTLVNPKNAPTDFVVGVTPNYYSPRFAGSHERWTVSETGMSLSTRWQDRQTLDFDVNLAVAFTKPPAQLTAGETVNLSATFSHGGSVNRGNPGIAFEYRGEGINLSGVRSGSNYPWAPRGAAPGEVSSSFVVPEARSGGEIKLHAFLWNCAACNVTWIYRAQ